MQPEMSGMTRLAADVAIELREWLRALNPPMHRVGSGMVCGAAVRLLIRMPPAISRAIVSDFRDRGATGLTDAEQRVIAAILSRQTPGTT